MGFLESGIKTMKKGQRRTSERLSKEEKGCIVPGGSEQVASGVNPGSEQKRKSALRFLGGVGVFW